MSNFVLVSEYFWKISLFFSLHSDEKRLLKVLEFWEAEQQTGMPGVAPLE